MWQLPTAFKRRKPTRLWHVRGIASITSGHSTQPHLTRTLERHNFKHVYRRAAFQAEICVTLPLIESPAPNFHPIPPAAKSSMTPRDPRWEAAILRLFEALKPSLDREIRQRLMKLLQRDPLSPYEL